MKINKNIFLMLLIVSIIIITMSSSVSAMTGSGSSIDPFMIGNCTDLQSVSAVEGQDYYYEVGNDIDCSDTINWNTGSGFDPIDMTINSGGFHFDGNNFTISNLTINRSSEQKVGLFGNIDSNPVLTFYMNNVVLENVYVVGDKYVSGFMAFTGNTGLVETLTNIHVSGYIEGEYLGAILGKSRNGVNSSSFDGIINCTGMDCGGIVGNIGSGGDIYDCQTSGTIYSTYSGLLGDATYLGGIIGLAPSRGIEIHNSFSSMDIIATGTSVGCAGIGGGSNIYNSYATGNISCPNFTDVEGISYQYFQYGAYTTVIEDSYFSGTVTGTQNNTNITTTNVFYNSDLASGLVGTAKTSAELQTQSTYSSFDTNVWDIENGYATLFWQHLFVTGNGTVIDPFMIYNCEQLQAIDGFVGNSYYELANDIDCSDTVNWNTGAGFEPIELNYETGVFSFNGNNFTISDLYINRTSDYVGLFSRFNCGYDVYPMMKNINLVDVNITGSGTMGAFIGQVILANDIEPMSNIHVTGNIIATGNTVGGIIGNGRADLFNCSFDGNIIGVNEVGGLVGSVPGLSININNSWTSGTIIGNIHIGGIISYGYDSWIYNTKMGMDITGTGIGYVGGFASEETNINNSYANGDVTCLNCIDTSGGFIGYGAGNSILNSYYNGTVTVGGAGVDENGTIWNTGMTISNVFYNNDISSEPLLGTAKTSAELQTQSTYSAFDTNVWDTTNRHYASLLWEGLDKPLFTESGSGTEIDPYMIANCFQLQNMADAIDQELYYELNNSIDCTSFNFTPINLTTNGNFSFDGNDFTILNVTINKSDLDYVGIFGEVGLYTNTQQVFVFEDFNVENINISGRDYVGVFGSNGGVNESSIISNVHVTGMVQCRSYCGGLVGEAYTKIQNSSFQGNIINTVSVSGYVGGLVGVFLNTIYNSYTTGSINAVSQYVGGLFGGAELTPYVDKSYSKMNVYVTGSASYVSGFAGQSTSCNINNSYATGFINCSDCSFGVGGLTGFGSGAGLLNSYFNGTVIGFVDSEGTMWNAGMNITNTFYNSDVSSQALLGTAKTSAELQTQSTYSAFDTNVWDTTDGYYASLLWEGLDKPLFTESGSGTEIDPYMIANCFQLQNMADVANISIYYELNNSIDCTSFNFTPINLTTTGNFSLDGNNFTIQNLTINNSGSQYTGLFGKIEKNENTSVLFNDINFDNIYLEGEDYVGSVVAFAQLRTYPNYGIMIINDVHTTGNMVTVGLTGGIAGEYYGSISNSSFEGNIDSMYNYVGGIVGVNPKTDAIIDNCYSKGLINVTSLTNVETAGGIIGYMASAGWITNSYSEMDVYVYSNGNANGVGGLSGSNSHINNSYATGDVYCPTCAYAVDGLQGKNTGRTISNSYYNGTLTQQTAFGGVIDTEGTMWNSGMTLNNVFYNSDATTLSIGTAKTSAELQIASTYSAFDTNVWDVVDTYYPTLVWEAYDYPITCSTLNATCKPCSGGWTGTSLNGVLHDYDFGNDPFNYDITNWDTSCITDMSSVFQLSSSIPNLENWDTSNVTTMAYMFYNTGLGYGGLENWNVSKVTDMRLMFWNSVQDISNLSVWDVSSVTNMDSMFANSWNLGDISDWNTSSLNTANSMFAGEAVDQDLSNWDVSSVTSMNNMFDGSLSTSNYDAILSGWSSQSVQPNVVFGVGATNYSDSVSRAILTDSPNNWTITDGGANSIAPTITSVEIFPEIITTRSSLVGSCLIEDLNDGEDINYSYRWYKNDVLVNAVSDVTLAEGTEISSSYGETPVEGDEWVFSCMGTDGLFDTVWQNSSTKTVIVNTAPATPSAYIQSPLQDTGSLVGICNGYDANNDTLSFNYITYKNGVQFLTGTSSNVASDVNVTAVTITSGNLVFDDNWTISCQANDGLEISSFANSTETIVVKNPVAPVISYKRMLPLILLPNETISATGLATDTNLDNLDYYYRLYVNDATTELKTNLSNVQGVETSVTFDYSDLAVGDLVKIGLQVGDVDPTPTAEERTSVVVVRASNDVPVMTNVRMSPNNFIGQDDTVTGYCTATDSEGDAVNYNYEWFVNDVSVKTGSKIYSNYIGYSQGVEVQVDTISSSYYAEGDYLKLSCSAYDVKNESVYLNNTAKYIYGENNFAPVMGSVVIVPSGSQNTLADFTLNATASDFDTSSISYEWRFVKNGAYQTISTSSSATQGVSYELGTLSNADTSAGDTYYARVRAFDGFDYSGWVSSNAITISNTVPTMSASNIINSPLENVSLQSYCTASDIDAEQSITFSKRWYKDGVFVTTGDTLSSSYTQQGENWILGCTANDGLGNSLELNSTGVVILESENFPVMATPTIEGSSITITGTCIATDVDGDALDYTYNLYENGFLYDSSIVTNVTQGVLQTKIYEPTINSGDVFMFSCEANDNQQGSSGNKNSTTLIVPSITFNYGMDYTTATTGRISWVDNVDTINVYLDNVLKASTSLTGWTFENLDPDTLYEIKLVPVKGAFSFAPRYINFTTEVTDNNDPVLEYVSINPATVYTETAVTGICRASDVESSNLYFTYTWKVNNVSVDTGVTSQYSKNTNVTVGALTSSNYKFNDTISLECTAFDGITNSGLNSTNLTVLNTEPIIDEELITIELSNDRYVCDYIYTDADGDAEINASYDWFVNGINSSILNSPTANTLLVSATNVDDEVICKINSGDAYYNVTKNSSAFIVGDFDNPIVSNLILPDDVYSDSSYLISATCEDNVGVASGYPKIRFINPNYAEEEFPMYYEGNDVYQRYHTFNIAGTYTQIEIECKDGNSNKDILEFNGTILSKSRSVVVNPGGGSGSAPNDDDVEVFRNITSFELVPVKQLVQMSAGSTKIMEFEVINNDIVDIDFTSAILKSTDTQVYDWMQFSDGTKATSFGILKENGLSSNSKFLRYTISIPSDVEVGTYKGIIEVNGMEQTETFNVEIEVTKGTFVRLFSALTDPIFELPFSLSTATPTGAVTGTVDGGSTPINAITILISLSVVGLGVFGFRRLRG